MRVLLDTHCWLWMQVSPGRFGATALDLVRSQDHQLLLSAASPWEIAIKSAMGRIELPEPPSVYVPKRDARLLLGRPHVRSLRTTESCRTTTGNGRRRRTLHSQ